MHNDMTVIAMSAEAVVERRERERLVTAIPLNHYFQSYAGEQLFTNKTPRLNEIQVCKIATHLLQALTYLMDMKMVHEDLSHRNYLVDKNLNTTLIDLGLVHLVVDRDGWNSERWLTLLATEFLNTPELTYKLMTSNMATSITAGETVRIEHTHDVRRDQMWKFGTLIYDLLHGYAHWEPPEWDPKVGALRDIHDIEKSPETISYVRMRRERMYFEDLPIDPELSQDCTDVLRALLSKKLEDRPSLEEIASFPWFQGHWADYPRETFKRPPFEKIPFSVFNVITYPEQQS